MTPQTRFFFAAQFLIFLFRPVAAIADGIPSLAQAMTNQQLILLGREAFLNRCSGCHGVNADGQGAAAPMLDPKPRNLVAGSFKFRSTPQGVLPTVEDLMRTINQGVLGTAMPSFRDVPEQQKLALVAYIRSLRPDFNDTKSDQLAVSLPPPPKDIFRKKAGLMIAAKRGRALYEKTCLSCHGPGGKGDGLAVEGMTDSENQPIRPEDLTAPFVKGGKTATDLFRAISVGLDGSPMPAFSDNFNEAQRWDLVAYLFYLRGRGAGIYTEKDAIP